MNVASWWTPTYYWNFIHVFADRTKWKTFRLAASSFCCWIPIYILAFTRLAGLHLSGDIYVGAAIILLPLNSALNPLLYSSAIVKIRKRFQSCLAKIQQGRLQRSWFVIITAGNVRKLHLKRSVFLPVPYRTIRFMPAVKTTENWQL